MLRESRIQNELEQLKELPYAEVVEVAPNNISREDRWIVWIKGKKGTIWQGGIFPVQITFPPTYPKVGPQVQFPKQFKHVHVYEGGVICMPILQQQYWKPKISMRDIIQRIVSLIHQDTNPFSPANLEVFTMSRQQPQKYQQYIKQQVKKYSKPQKEYFMESCYHITILEDEDVMEIEQ